MKLILTVLDGTLAGQTFDLDTGHLLIGRSRNCSVRFDPFSENIVSSQHAFIFSTPDGYFLSDNESTNGTFLNGERVAKSKLKDGDEIVFGRGGIRASVGIADEPAGVGESIRTTIESVPPDIAAEIPVTEPAAAAAVQEGAPAYFEKVHSSPVNLNQTMTGLGLSAPAVKMPPPQTGKYIAVAVMSVLIILAAVPVLLIIVAGLGPVATVVATTAAFLPVAIYLAPLLWLDRYDPEPFWLLLLCFSWGAVVAVFASAIVNDVITMVATISTQSPELGEIAGAVISAPFIEETMKGLGLLAMLLFFRRHFDDMLDGIVFAGVIALGFATVENVLYYGRGFLEEGIQGLGVMFVLRGMLSPFAHVTFTVMTGIGCGLARESHNWAVRILMPLLGYGVAMALHAIWNGMGIAMVIALEVSGTSGYCSVIGLGGMNLGICGFLIGYAIFEIPVFLIFVGFSLYIMRRQSRTLREMLAIDVARGLIRQEHLDIATSMFKSIFWSLGGLTKGKFLNRRRYLRAIGSLGLSYWHIQRATAAQGHTGSFQTNPFLRAEVEKYGKLV